ncbi:MAG: UDP-N-acetylmuramate--L-alanine ligase [Thiohalomonadales bacterium]
MELPSNETDRLGRIRRIHLVGIGGVGMSGIAEVLLNLGYIVTGSDLKHSKVIERLETLGGKIALGHAENNTLGSDVVVVSSAVDENNPEVVAARNARIPVVPRAEMLAELMRFRYGIAVAGTHGKTTTTSLVACILAEGGLDPTFVIGGRLNSVGTHAKLGASRYIVAEADESDASFLHLKPMMAVVTNIDSDHMSTYGNDFQQLKQAFSDFLHQLPFYGLAIICIDDEQVRELLPRISKPTLSYGFSHDAEVRAFDWRQQGATSEFSVVSKYVSTPMKISLNMPGVHNVLNALAAIAVAQELAVDEQAIQTGLANFSGIARRFEQLGEIPIASGSVMLVDDYAHHPRELDATVIATRASWPERRLVLVFQPHRYSRTRDLFEDFVEVLSSVDVLILTEVFAAGESAIAGADGRALIRAIRSRGHIEPVFVEKVDDIDATLVDLLKDGDILLTSGAGSIGVFAAKLPERLRELNP